MKQDQTLKNAKLQWKRNTLKNRYCTEDRFLDICIGYHLRYDEALELLKYIKKLGQDILYSVSTDMIEHYLDTEEDYKSHI